MKKALVSAIVAGALAAVIIPGTASATTLCKTNENPCPAASKYPDVSVIEATSSKVVMTGFIQPIFGTQLHCESTIKLQSSVSGGELSFSTPELKWSTCVAAETATTIALPSFSAGGASKGNGVLTFTKGMTVRFTGAGGPERHTCEMSIGTGQQFNFTGGLIGSAAKVTATAVPTTITGFECQKSSPSQLGADGSTLGGEVTQPYVITKVNGATSGKVFLEP